MAQCGPFQPGPARAAVAVRGRSGLSRCRCPGRSCSSPAPKGSAPEGSLALDRFCCRPLRLTAPISCSLLFLPGCGSAVPPERARQRSQSRRCPVLAARARAQGTGLCPPFPVPAGTQGSALAARSAGNKWICRLGRGCRAARPCSQTSRPSVAEPCSLRVSQVKNPSCQPWSPLWEWQVGNCEKVKLTVE